MKTMTKLFLYSVVLALMVTACQKADEDFGASLKSATPYDLWLESWSPAGGAEAECAQASNLLQIPSCGLSYKVEPWIDGDYESGISIKNSDDNSFDWNSTGPVCIIIVKAGRGAYLYKANGATSGSIELPYKAKGISHVSFCYGQSSIPSIIALKVWYTTSTGGSNFTTSTGTYPILINAWCDLLGVNTLAPTADPIQLQDNAGFMTIEKGISSWIITVDLADGLSNSAAFLYAGSLTGLTSDQGDMFGCPNYSAWSNQNTENANVFYFYLPL